MAKIFLVISIVITLLSGGLAFLTKGKIDGLKNSLTATRASEARLTTDKRQLQTDLKKTNEDLTASNKTVDDQKAQLATAAMDLTTAKAETAKAKEAADESEKSLTTAKMDLEKAQMEIAEYKAKMPQTPGGPAPAPDELAKLRAEVAEAHQVADTLKQREKDSEQKVASLNREVERYRKQLARPGITGRVVAVNPGWNFLVVDVGDRRGAVMNASLLVTRGGQTVARARITSVEPSTSIADVIPGSLQRGVSVQPGDSVIFAGRQPAPGEDAGAAGANGGAGAGATPAPTLGGPQAQAQ